MEGGALRGRVSGPRPLLVSPALDAQASAFGWAVVRLRAWETGEATLGWASSARNGWRRCSFPVVADGEAHTYNLDLAGRSDWGGKALLLTFEPPGERGALFALHSLGLAEEPAGPALPVIEHLATEHEQRGAGRVSRVVCRVRNLGGQAAERVQARLALPEGCALRGEEEIARRYLEPGRSGTFIWQIGAPAGVDGEVRVSIAASNAAPVERGAPVSGRED